LLLKVMYLGVSGLSSKHRAQVHINIEEQWDW
jgi:hypothetical protein